MTGEPWKRQIARIRGAREIAGTGLLAVGGVVLTCAHVVAEALRGTGETPGPGAEVTLDLPFAGRRDIKAVVAGAGWYPKILDNERSAGGPPSDVAVLVPLDQDAVAGVMPCLVAEGVPQVGTELSAWGFPKGYPDGALSQGSLQGADSADRLDIKADDDRGHFFEPGFSGAPAFVGRGASVVAGTAFGLCATSDASEKKIARFIPPGHLAHALRGVVSPYRWLRPFAGEDASFFFGRDALSDVLWQELQERRILLLAGPPGSGKSSVLRAGLGVRAAAAGHAVRIVRPLADGWAELAAAFGLAQDAGEARLAGAVQAQAKRQPLLLGIDQAEELVRGTGAAERAASLLQLLAHLLAASKGLTLALAARVDALGALFAVQPRPGRPYGRGLLEEHLRNLDPLGREELLAAVERPARRLGARFEDGLAEGIVEDALREQAPLPVVQLCLSRLWERRRDAEISADAYVETGKVAGALARHASGVLDGIPARVAARFPDAAGLADAVATHVRRLLLHLVEVGASKGEDRRRRILEVDLPRLDDRWFVEDVAHEATRLAREALEEGRLIVAARLADGAEALELVHDSLLTEWAELRDWIADDRGFHLWRARIQTSLAAWITGNRADEGSLLRGGALGQAEEWLAKKGADLGRDEVAFVEASIALAAREEAARQAARLAEANLKRQAAVSQSLRLAVAARGLLARSPETALLLAGEAIRLDHNAVTDEALREASGAAGAEVVRLGINVAHLAFAEGGALVVLADGGVSRFGMDGSAVPSFQIAGPGVFGGGLSPDGTWVLAVGADGKGHLVDRDGARRVDLPAPTICDRLRTFSTPFIHWSPDGNLVLVADGASAWIWDVPERRVRAPWDHREAYSSALTHWGNLTKQERVNSKERKELQELRATGHVNRVFNAALSPDGERVATASEDGTIKLWDRDGRHLITFKEEKMGPAVAVAFLATGLVTGHMDGAARLWDENGTLLLKLGEHGADVGTVLANPARDGFVTAVDGGGEHDGAIRLWDLNGTLRRTFAGHSDHVSAVAFSTDGRLLASGSSDKTVRVWAEDGACLAVLRGHEAPVVQVTFDASGTRLLSRAQDGEARLWRWRSEPSKVVARAPEIVVAASYWGGDDLVVSTDFDGKTRITHLADETTCEVLPGMSARRAGAEPREITGDCLWTFETERYFGAKGLEGIVTLFDGQASLTARRSLCDLTPPSGHASPAARSGRPCRANDGIG